MKHSNFGKTLTKNITIALAYLITGWFGSLLAIPPEYATIFWPPSGFALAFVYLYGYKCLPGVFIGAFATNFQNLTLNTDLNFLLQFVQSALMISLGATLQAALGTFMINRSIGPKTHFIRFSKILYFSAFGGPVSCIIAATIGTFALWTSGTINTDAIATTWGTWYIGDILGVVVFAPILVLLLTPQTITKTRKAYVTIPLLILFTAVISIFFMIKDIERGEQIEKFKNDTALIKAQLNQEFKLNIQEIETIRAVYNASNFVTNNEFETLLKNVFERRPSLLAASWAPLMSASTEKALIKKHGISSLKHTKIEDGVIVPYGSNAIYTERLPVIFNQPKTRKNNIIGFDILSEEKRRKAIQTARATRQITATAPLILADGNKSLGFVVFAPIFKKSQATDDDFNGVITMIFKYKTIIAPILEQWQYKGINIQVFDYDNDKALAYISGNDDENNPHAKSNHDFFAQYDYDFFGRKLHFEFRLSKNYVLSHITWSIWLVLALGLSFTFFTSVFLLMMTGQTEVVKNLISEKTAELASRTRFLNTIMETSPDLIFVKNQKSEIIEANKAFLERLAPEKRENIIGKTGLEEHSKDKQQQYIEHDQYAFDTGYSSTQELNTGYKGDTITLSTKKIRFEDTDGTPYILGIARDVSDFILSQNKLQTILDTTADGLITIREDGSIESFNKACEIMFGYTAEEAIGKNFDTLTGTPDDLDDTQTNITGTGLETFGFRKDGSHFPILISMAEVHLNNRTIYSALIHDISEQKETLEQLQQSEEKFKTSLESSMIGIALVDMDQNWIVYNQALSDMLGYTYEEFAEIDLQSMTHKDDVSKDRAELRALLSGEIENYSVEKRYIHKKGNAVWILLSISLVKDKKGNPEYFITHCLDITAEKEAKEMQDQLGKMIETSVTEFYIFDAKSLKFLEANKVTLSNLQYTLTQLKKMNATKILSNYTKDDIEKLASPLLKNTRKAVEFDTQHQRKDGTRYDVLVNLQLIDYKNKKAFMAIVMDITERKKMEAELLRSNKELEDFAYVASHDLKAPLRHVTLSAGFLKENYSDQLDDKAKNFLDVMEKSSERMQTMIESLLAYSRVGRSDQKDFETIQMNDVMDEVTDVLKNPIDENNATIQYGDLLEIHGNKSLLIQLLQNLIQNAIKYRKEDIEPNISISASQKNKELIIRIADNGIGIDPKFADKIFMVFQRLHREGEYEGVGIGLSICQRIVEFHKGTIHLNVEYDQGCEFVITLPTQ